MLVEIITIELDDFFPLLSVRTHAWTYIMGSRGSKTHVHVITWFLYGLGVALGYVFGHMFLPHSLFHNLAPYLSCSILYFVVYPGLHQPVLEYEWQAYSVSVPHREWTQVSEGASISLHTHVCRSCMSKELSVWWVSIEIYICI